MDLTKKNLYMMFAMLILPAVSCDRQWKASQTELNYLASLIRFLRPLYWLFFLALRVIISSDQELSNLSVSAAMQQATAVVWG